MSGGSLWPVVCAHCGVRTFKPVGAINRAAKRAAPMFCGKACFGLSRRQERSDAEKRAIKAAYDAEYRTLNQQRLKVKKAAYYQRVRDPEKERELRKAKMPRHVEYCRRPEYRKWKAEYDRHHRAQKYFGPFADAALVIADLEREITSRASRYEIYSTNGTLNKKLQRRRDYETLCG